MRVLAYAIVGGVVIGAVAMIFVAGAWLAAETDFPLWKALTAAFLMAFPVGALPGAMAGAEK